MRSTFRLLFIGCLMVLGSTVNGFAHSEGGKQSSLAVSNMPNCVVGEAHSHESHQTLHQLSRHLPFTILYAYYLEEEEGSRCIHGGCTCTQSNHGNGSYCSYGRGDCFTHEGITCTWE